MIFPKELSKLVNCTMLSTILAIQAGCDPVPDPPEIPSAEEHAADDGSDPGEEEGSDSSSVEIQDNIASAIVDTRARIESAPFEANEVLWTVNAQPIHSQAFELVKEGLRVQIESQTPPDQLEEALGHLDEEARNRLIATNLLEQAALEAGLLEDLEVTEALVSNSNEIMAQRFLEDQVATKLEQADVEAWYSSHLVQYRSETHPDGVKPLEEVRAEIESTMQEEAMLALMAELRDQAQLVPGNQPNLVADSDGDGVLSPSEEATLTDGSIEPLPPAPEGSTVAIWINGKAYTESYFLNIISPMMRRAEMGFQQQLQQYLMGVPEDQQDAVIQQAIARFKQQMAQEEQMLRESILNQTLLADRAVEMGYSEDRDVKLKKAILRTEVLASFYFERHAQSLMEQGETPGRELMQTVVEGLWVKADIKDAAGTPIPPPDRHPLQ
jgi:hypothetical protein